VMTTLAEEDPYTQCTYVIDRAGQISKSFVKLGSLGKKYYLVFVAPSRFLNVGI
jgi:hypothetical protein